MPNYAAQYAQTLSQAYPYVLRFGALYARKQEGDYNWVNAHTIEVPSISVTGRVDASRSAITDLGSRTQKHSNTWTPLALTFHRKWDDFVHPKDIDETNMALSIGNITRVFNEEQKFLEMDRYCVSKIYGDFLASGRVPLTATLSVQNVLEYFDRIMIAATEKNVPETGRILYVTPLVKSYIDNAISLYRTQQLQTPAAISRAINTIDNVVIETVPSDSMKTIYDFTVGSVPGQSAKQIEMFLVHPSAIITPVNYEFASLDAPSAVTEGKWMYFEESYGDVFILPNKQYAVDFVVAGLSSGSATFTSEAGTAAVGDTKVTITAPTGTNVMTGSRYFYKTKSGAAETALGYGENAVDAGGWTEWDGKNTTVLSITNGYYMTLLVTDAEGRVYYSGNGVITSLADAAN